MRERIHAGVGRGAWWQREAELRIDERFIGNEMVANYTLFQTVGGVGKNRIW